MSASSAKADRRSAGGPAPVPFSGLTRPFAAEMSRTVLLRSAAFSIWDQFLANLIKSASTPFQ